MNLKSSQQTNHRDIYLFASDANDSSFIAQKLTLNDVVGLKERDILVHEIVGFKGNEKTFKKFKVDMNGFTFVLVGKDGSEKLRSDKPISLKKLYGTIDAMPMRRNEMQK